MNKSLVKPIVTAALVFVSAGVAAKGAGPVTRPSAYGLTETVQKIESLATSKGMTIFARIDHSGAAKAAGLEMRPTQGPIRMLSGTRGRPLSNRSPSHSGVICRMSSRLS